jgi:hypothetical protein
VSRAQEDFVFNRPESASGAGLAPLDSVDAGRIRALPAARLANGADGREAGGGVGSAVRARLNAPARVCQAGKSHDPRVGSRWLVAWLVLPDFQPNPEQRSADTDGEAQEGVGMAYVRHPHSDASRDNDVPDAQLPVRQEVSDMPGAPVAPAPPSCSTRSHPRTQSSKSMPSTCTTKSTIRSWTVLLPCSS